MSRQSRRSVAGSRTARTQRKMIMPARTRRRFGMTAKPSATAAKSADKSACGISELFYWECEGCGQAWRLFVKVRGKLLCAQCWKDRQR